MNYLFHILIMINIYVILALSLNLIVGYGGLIFLSQAAFYGIGAYIYSLLLINNVSWLLSLVTAIFMTSTLSLIVGIRILKLKNDFFLLATIALQMIVFDILNNWTSLTKGPYGITDIPRINIWNFKFDSTGSNLIIISIFTAIVILFSMRLYKSHYGRLLKSIREDELLTNIYGKNTEKIKLWSFVIAAGIAALAGSLFASYYRYIDPTSFTLSESIFIFTIVLVGGSGNLRGPIIGSIVLVLLPEALRFLGLPQDIAPNVRQIIYGVLLIILMFLRPQGIIGEYKLS